MRKALTYDICFAACMDAGNRSMRKAGRTKWNRQDKDAAAAEFDRLAANLEPQIPNK